MKSVVSLSVAALDQSAQIRDLINLAYRGTVGWTRETEIVAGDRATLAEIESAISNSDSEILIYEADAAVRACICLKKVDNEVHIGLFAVHPSHQGHGLGKVVLSLAEDYALTVMQVHTCVMSVVSQRPELIAYYERRGYVRSGMIEAYPLHLEVGKPKVSGLTVECLRKSLPN